MDIAALKTWIEELGVKIGRLEMEIKGLKEENELLRVENNSLKMEISTLKKPESESEPSTAQFDSDRGNNDSVGIEGPQLAKKLIKTYQTLVNGKRRRIHSELSELDDRIDGDPSELGAHSSEDEMNENETEFVGIPIQPSHTQDLVIQQEESVDDGTESERVGMAVDSSEEEEMSLESAKNTGNGKGNRLFYGMQFFLTTSIHSGYPSSNGISGSLRTYDRDEYRETIENKGGNVLSRIGWEKNKGKSHHIFLISDAHARTTKYLYCVAAGIPCVSYLWIEECLKQNSIVDWKPFELNSGWSIEASTVIPAHKKKPLKGIRIYTTVEKFWNSYLKSILTAAEANLLQLTKSGKKHEIPADTEILVTDKTCSSVTLDMAHDKNIPVVTIEWVAQTIITGKRAEYGGHEEYHVESDVDDDDAEKEEVDH